MKNNPVHREQDSSVIINDLEPLTNINEDYLDNIADFPETDLEKLTKIKLELEAAI